MSDTEPVSPVFVVDEALEVEERRSAILSYLLEAMENPELSVCELWLLQLQVSVVKALILGHGYVSVNFGVSSTWTADSILCLVRSRLGPKFRVFLDYWRPRDAKLSSQIDPNRRLLAVTWGSLKTVDEELQLCSEQPFSSTRDIEPLAL